MNTDLAVTCLDALASPVRLDIYRLLVRTGPDGLVAGEIATTLALPANNTSFHLKTLSQAGLMAATPEGRFLRYRARMAAMTALVDFLTAECCQGQPELCGSTATVPDCPRPATD